MQIEYGIIGYPLVQSFSKIFFEKKFADEGIDAAYHLFRLNKIDELNEVLKIHENLRGFNVTIPYKKEVIPFLHDATDAVKQMGACNCVKLSNGKLFGYNTDVVGFEGSLKPLLSKHHTRALVLGTGGAAAAVAYVLEQLNIPFLFVSRSAANKKNIINYDDISGEIMQAHSLIINATPAGMFPDVEAFPPIPYQYLTKEHLLYDLIYKPDKTVFLQKGEDMGCTIKNGYEMLILQAEANWKIWNEV